MSNLGILYFIFLILQVSQSQLSFTQTQIFTQAAATLFGSSVVINGNNLVVGASGQQGYTGAIYFYLNNGATTSYTYQSYVAPGTTEYFGSALAMEGGNVIIGAYGEQSSQGAVYVYGLTQGYWVQFQRITASDGASRDNFGFSLSLNGNTLAIGAYGKNQTNGAVYIFTNNGTWSLQNEILAPFPSNSFSRFGYSLALFDSTLVVGAPGITGGFVGVYTLSGTSFALVQSLNFSVGVTFAQFGFAISFDGNTIAVGANQDGGGIYYSGTVFLYHNVGGVWVLQTTLQSAIANTNVYFGISVSVSRNILVVGTSINLAYIYRNNGSDWSISQLLNSTDPNSQSFGSYVYLNLDTLIIADQNYNNKSGALYIYTEPLITTEYTTALQTTVQQTTAQQTTVQQTTAQQTTKSNLVNFALTKSIIPSFLILLSFSFLFFF